MSLRRENILSMIGSRRYHSAILTSFSFDFFFFEVKAMKWLRSCGVRNVNVLIDGHYYAELMEQGCGEEMLLSPGYSLYPVFHKSIFHPKIWMLFGEKESLLIIGSGNLTNAGNGNNDEIWGAFHFDIRLSDNIPLFSSAWSYVKQLCESTKGFIYEKTNRWIIDHSRWLNDLPSTTPFQFSESSGKGKVAFLSNTNGSTIWQQLTALIGKEKIVEITTLSPFYDTKGISIQALKALYTKAQINVVIDESGSVPDGLPQSKALSFYNWNDLGVSKTLHSNKEDTYAQSKLHAKIIHFKTNAGKEFCLFGSANVTPEGLGLPGTFSNNEVSILMQSDNGGLLNQLGIKLKLPKKLSEFKAQNKLSIYEAIIKSHKSKIKLLSAEWVYDELYLYLEGNYTGPLTAKLYDRENRLVNTVGIGEVRPEIKAKPSKSLVGSHHVQLFDASTDKPVSNKILLADYFLLAKTHPNPKTEDIERIYNDIQSGEFTRVLDLLQYAMLDESETDETANILTNRNAQHVRKDEKRPPDKLYDLSSYKPIEHSSIEKSLLLSSLSLRVLDILKFIRSKEFSKITEAELRIDEQEVDLASISGKDEKEMQMHRLHNFSLAMLKSQKLKLLSYFDHLFEYQQFLVYDNEKPLHYKPTLTDLSKYMIALELMLEFSDKSERYVDNGKEHFFSFLPVNGEEPYNNDNAKGCSLNLIGDFLMLSRSGFKEYEFEYTKNKIEQLKTEALVSSIVCLLNIRWKEDEQPYFNTLLLNCLHYLGERNFNSFNKMLPLLMIDIDKKLRGLKHPSYFIAENLSWFQRRIIPAFKRTIQQLEARQFDTISRKGMIIYKSPWGYCYVKDVSKQNDFTLIRPGFIWDDNQRDYMMHNNDEVYKPLKLSSFVSVEF